MFQLKGMYIATIWSFTLGLIAMSASAETIERLYSAQPKTELWRISEPQVNVRQKSYNQIVLRQGDSINMRADGCVQTGGHGSTWKRYVNPDFGGSIIYKGQVKIPGLFWSFTNLQDVVPVNGNWSSRYVVTQTGGTLTLGYLDDDYSDNGYWGHDDGTNNQCLGIGSANFYIFITRK